MHIAANVDTTLCLLNFMLKQNFILQITRTTHVKHSFIPFFHFSYEICVEGAYTIIYLHAHMYICVHIVGSRQQREWNIRVSTFVLLHRVRGGTGCRISIDLLTELQPVAESSGRKGEEGLARR